MKKSSFTIGPLLVVFFVFSSWVKVTDYSFRENAAQEVKIGEQIWMATNLNVETFANGDSIPEARTKAEWREASNNRKPAWCYYNNDPANGEKYGKLYNWYAVNDPRGLAPEGWRIPIDTDWYQLALFLGGNKGAGAKLKSTSGWKNEGNGTNTSNFTGLSCGTRGIELFGGKDGFQGIGKFAIFWSATQKGMPEVNVFTLSCKHDDLFYSFGDPSDGLSVRCIKN
jgi:uncharacterized protein (TIGR02145 family)